MFRSRISKSLIGMRHRKIKVLSVVIMCMLYYILSVGDYIFSRSFDNDFDYPLNIDIRPVVEEVLTGFKPSVKPINYYPFRFLTNSGKCNTYQQLDLFIVVKSALQNFDHRDAIRQTYGQENIIPGKHVKTLFFLGIPSPPNTELQKKINEEIAKHKDIIQIEFHDHYFNNTIKTMMSFRWLYQHCSNAKFYLFTDDDMYISVSNLLNYVEVDDRFTSPSETSTLTYQYGHLYTGYVFKSGPLRHKVSKWRVSLNEYPWDKWPPYVTAGAYVISNRSMKYLYIASFFVKHFRFDDIYLGIVAKKVGIEVTHCPEFYFYSKKYSKAGFKNVIASHGFHNHADLLRAWREQNDVKILNNSVPL